MPAPTSSVPPTLTPTESPTKAPITSSPVVSPTVSPEAISTASPSSFECKKNKDCDDNDVCTKDKCKKKKGMCKNRKIKNKCCKKNKHCRNIFKNEKCHLYRCNKSNK